MSRKRKKGGGRNPFFPDEGLPSDDVLKAFSALLSKQSKLSQKEIALLYAQAAAKMLDIPLSIFSTDELTPYEALVLYLSRSHRTPEIARILAKPYMNVYLTLRKAKTKHKKPFTILSQFTIPLTTFLTDKLTINEALVLHLHDQGLRNCDIARLLCRDNRNIWAVTRRAKKRRGGHK